MNIVIIDNYDSFTYNLKQLIEESNTHQVTVIRNDKFKLDDLKIYDKIVLSPGPGIPKDAGRLLEVIKTYANKKPILGVCLGHQAIGEVFGAKLENLSKVFHGIQSEINITNNDYIFNNLKAPLLVGRYHSWVISQKDFPNCLEIIATSEEGQIMAIRHKVYDIKGIQFHPESVLTPQGKTMINNFINH